VEDKRLNRRHVDEKITLKEREKEKERSATKKSSSSSGSNRWKGKDIFILIMGCITLLFFFLILTGNGPPDFPYDQIYQIYASRNQSKSFEFLESVISLMDHETLLQLKTLLQSFIDHTTTSSPTAASSILPSSGLRPGQKMRMSQNNVKGIFPVVMIPGFVGSGLEIWEGEICAKGYVRKRMWGMLSMLQTVLLENQCWLKHMKLDEVTGLDPPDIRIRATLGFDASDYLMPKIWCWGPLIENFADIGYDANNMYLASYDWRLAYANMEKRDYYFTRLKNVIELFKAKTEEKVVILAHSMGANLYLYFQQWVTHENASWIDIHIHSFVNIGGPILGFGKSLVALTSGELPFLGPAQKILDMIKYTLDNLRSLFQSWLSMLSMLPKGGDTIWGNQFYNLESNSISWQAPDDISLLSANYSHLFSTPSVFNGTYANMIMFKDDGKRQSKNMTAEEAIKFLFKNYPVLNRHKENIGLGIALSFEGDENKKRYQNEKYWDNPLENQLPVAPQMKYYCMYGVGIRTERAYFYKPQNGELDQNIIIDDSINDPQLQTTLGVMYSDGDGTVPLSSLSYMCVKGWAKGSRYNPSNSKVIVKEFLDDQEPFWKDLRGGPRSGDHVNIMGNEEMIHSILLILTNQTDHLEENRIYSMAQQVADRVPLGII